MEIIGRRVTDFLDELPLVPAACILIVSRSTEYSDGRREEIKTLLTLVKCRLPSSCALIGCVGAGVIGTGEGGISEEVEMAEGVSLMLMPQIEGTTAHVINLGLTEVKNNRNFKPRWEKSLKIPSDGTVKCAFLLAKGDTYNLDVIGKVASGIWKVSGSRHICLGHRGSETVFHRRGPMLKTPVSKDQKNPSGQRKLITKSG